MWNVWFFFSNINQISSSRLKILVLKRISRSSYINAKKSYHKECTKNVMQIRKPRFLWFVSLCWKLVYLCKFVWWPQEKKENDSIYVNITCTHPVDYDVDIPSRPSDYTRPYCVTHVCKYQNITCTHPVDYDVDIPSLLSDYTCPYCVLCHTRV